MSRIEKYSLTSGGAAYNLNIGFVPDTVEVWNYTQWAVDAKTVKSYWHRGMTTAYALNERCEDTSTNRTASTSNGFTVLETTSIATNQSAVSAITAANPPVVTVASTSLFTTDDVVRLHNIGGMTQVEGVSYNITVINSTTFSLQDMDGNDIDGTAFTAYTSSADDFAVDITAEVRQAGQFRITLGTDVVGADSDVLYVTATQADTFTALGDIG